MRRTRWIGRIAAVLALLMALASCGMADGVGTLADRQGMPDIYGQEEWISEVAGTDYAGEWEVAPMAYVPTPNMSMEDTVAAYFEQHYKSYTSLSYNDISAILDTSVIYNKNMVTWMRTLIQRRKLIRDNNLCYVETNKHPYTITFISASALRDNRLSYWSGVTQFNEQDTVVHFTITGDSGKVYPPIMAVNTQHTMRLRKIGGQWKVTYHYFPGSFRKFGFNTAISMPSSSDMLASLKKEFATVAAPAAPSVPAGAIKYDGVEAAKYGGSFTEKRNSSFYVINDWMGNCANFTSQCIWYGFGQKNTKTWWGGGGGGSAAWENVGHFYNYAAQGKELKCISLSSAKSLQRGDLLQIRNGGSKTFNHSLLVVNEEKLILGQNSPGCFVYYSDLVNVQFRYIRPVYLNPSSSSSSEE